MAKNLGAAVLALLDHERVDLRVAAATVLAAVGKGDQSVTRALSARLEDPDPEVRRIVLDGLARLGASGLAPQLLQLLDTGDDEVVARAAVLLANQGASAESALRKRIRNGSASSRRVVAQLLLRRGSQAAVEAVLDQLGDPDVADQVLQLVRAELDTGAEKLASNVDKVASARAEELGKQLLKEWARATREAATVKAKPRARPSKPNGHPADPLHDRVVAALIAELGLLLRLLGYMARPSSLPLLIGYLGPDRPRPVRLAAITALRRLVAAGEGKGIEAAVEALIDCADGDDLAVAQAAIDTLRGARIPESLAKRFAALSRSKNSAAQTLAMERLPAGGGASAVKALVDALGSDDQAASGAAARGLARAPEAVLPLVRALAAATDETVARRYAATLRGHRGHIPEAAQDELAAAARRHLELHGKGKATADTILVERVLLELLADLAPAVHVEILIEQARRLRRAGKVIEAFGAIKSLMRPRAEIDAAILDDHRFFVAQLGLEAGGDAILRAAHADDPVLEQFGRLARAGYSVAKKLAKAKEVSDEAIYGLGFRLLESRDDADRDLGAELLEGIIEERPRSKLARTSRNKLKLSGYLDDGDES